MPGEKRDAVWRFPAVTQRHSCSKGGRRHEEDAGRCAGVGLAAGVANATTLYMKFAGTGADEITLHPSETVGVEIWITGMRALDTLVGLQFSNGPAPGLVQTGVQAAKTGWSGELSVNRPLRPPGSPRNEVTLVASHPQYTIRSTPDVPVLVGTQVLHANQTTGPFELTFDVDDGSVSQNPKPWLCNEAGADWSLVVGTGVNPSLRAFELGKGSPGYTIGYATDPKSHSSSTTCRSRRTLRCCFWGWPPVTGVGGDARRGRRLCSPSWRSRFDRVGSASLLGCPVVATLVTLLV